MTDDITRMIAEGATAEQAVMAFTELHPINCNTCRYHSESDTALMCKHCESAPCPLQKHWIDLLAAYGARERQAGRDEGKREAWRAMCTGSLCHRYSECKETFEACLLLKGGE
jgi:hypothetical protein